MNLVMEIRESPPVEIFQKTMVFSETGGKIGRSKSAKWALNDPSREISNFHAQISFENGRYYLTDISSNGTFQKTPYKRLTKGVAVALDQSSEIIIGKYTIGVRTLEGDFSSNKPPADTKNSPEPLAIPDGYFAKPDDAGAFGVIDPSPVEERDILSFVDGAATSGAESLILPDLDDILNDADSVLSHDPLGIHIDPPTLHSEETPKVHEQPSAPADGTPPPAHAAGTDEAAMLEKIFSLTLGVDMQAMSPKEKEVYVQEVAQLAKTSIEELRRTWQALLRIQTLLVGEIPASKSNPIKTALNEHEILENLHKYSPPVSSAVPKLFGEVTAHSTALYSVLKDASYRVAERFSPDRLALQFEKDPSLQKKFANKDALNWEAYRKRFAFLDSIEKGDGNDFMDWHKAYLEFLEILRIQEGE